LLDNRLRSPRRYQLARYLDDYQHIENYPYLHLLDGGISDNLGIRPIINTVTMSVVAWEKLNQLGLTHTSKFVVITVNAQNREEAAFSKRDYSVPLFDAIGASSSVPLNQYSFETMEILRNKMVQWEKNVSAARCQDESSPANPDNNAPAAISSECAVDTYLIEVSFEAMEDAVERKHLENLPTTFVLEPEDVDRLKAVAKKSLQASPVFQKLLSDLQ
jgi:NTE family protein